MQTGDVLRGKYRLVRLLGDGGMGSVYEAVHEGLGTHVAIKVLHSDLARRPGLVERFLREAKVAAQIKSPHVVQVVDVERTEEGVAYIVMELLEGESLSGILMREGKLATHVACEYARQILLALEAAHGLGVVHRDLKPENVFVLNVGGSPHLKLIDFGIAKIRQLDAHDKNLTVAGVVMGTPEYMAPEQAHSADKVDARSDIYAVGVMLYEMLSGTRPATGDDARLVALMVERGEVRPLVHAAPGVPPDLAGLVHRAMAARPDLRFSGAAEMRRALEGAGAGRRPGATPTGAHTSAPPPAVLPRRSSPPSPEPGPAAPQPRGTVMSDPNAEGLTPAHAHPGASGAPPPYGAGAYTPGSYAVSPQLSPPAPARPRNKRAGSSIWLLVALPVLLGVGIVIAFAMGGSTGESAAQPKPSAPPPPPHVTVAPTGTSSTTAAPPAPTPAPNDTVAPLVPATPYVPPSHPVAPPGNNPPRPHPSASASASPSAAPSASESSPFPFPVPGFPAIPNPFPSPSNSGVGPVMTIPTTLPFPFPGAPAPAPSSSTPPAPSPSGKAI